MVYETPVICAAHKKKYIRDNHSPFINEILNKKIIKRARLTLFMAMFPFYTLWKRFSEGIEREHWPENGLRNKFLRNKSDYSREQRNYENIVWPFLEKPKKTTMES